MAKNVRNNLIQSDASSHIVAGNKTIPVSAPDGTYIVYDRPNIDYYDLHLPDEVFAALLDTLNEAREDYGDYFEEFLELYPSYKSLFTLVGNLKEPVDGKRAVQARHLIALAKSRGKATPICPRCGEEVTEGSAFFKRRYACTYQCGWIGHFEDTLKVEPTMYTRDVINLLELAGYPRKP